MAVHFLDVFLYVIRNTHAKMEKSPRAGQQAAEQQGFSTACQPRIGGSGQSRLAQIALNNSASGTESLPS